MSNGSTRKKKLTEKWIKRLETQLGLEPLMRDFCQALMELSHADRCSIMVLDGGSGEELSVRWAQGVRVKPYGKSKFRVGDGLCGWVARSQRPLFSLDVSKELRFAPDSPKKPRRHPFREVKSLICLPLVIEGRTIGVVNLSSFSKNRKLKWAKNAGAKLLINRLTRVIAQAALLHEVEGLSERWKRQVKATSETVSQVSHEIRTPLTLITEGAQQLLDGFSGTLSPEHQERISEIKTHADRMLRLVTELLDLSRIEAGRATVHRVPMDWEELIREVADRYATLVSPRRLNLKLDKIPPVYGDRSRLSQVVENLLINAVKFTPADGEITLKLVARGRSAELAVSDTGMGIPPKEQRRLFEKFFQPKLPTSLSVRGTGLGLTIVKEVIQLHGGTIRVQSEEGKGTTFTASLPLYSHNFALTEEFRILRHQAAREGKVLAVQGIESKSHEPLDVGKVVDLLARHVSREDRVLEHPEGGIVLLSVSDRDGFRAIRTRLQKLLSIHPQLTPASGFSWGWALVPDDETSLPAVLTLVKKRAEEEVSSEHAIPVGGRSK